MNHSEEPLKILCKDHLEWRRIRVITKEGVKAEVLFYPIRVSDEEHERDHKNREPL